MLLRPACRGVTNALEPDCGVGHPSRAKSRDGRCACRECHPPGSGPARRDPGDRSRPVRLGTWTIDVRDYAMMPPRAAATGLPRCDQRVRFQPADHALLAALLRAHSPGPHNVITLAAHAPRHPRLARIRRLLQRPPSTSGDGQCPATGAAARADHRPGRTHPASHRPPRPPRRTPTRVRTCRLTSPDVILGRYRVKSPH